MNKFKLLVLVSSIVFSLSALACNYKNGHCPKYNKSYHKKYNKTYKKTYYNKHSHYYDDIHYYNDSYYYGGGSSGYYHNGYYSPYADTYNGYYYNNTGYTSGTIYTSCSPSMVDSNVQKTDKLVSSFLKNEKYKNEEKFNATIASITKEKNEEKRLAAYFSLVDVSTPSEIAYFIGARKNELNKYESSLIKNTEINAGLASEVVSKLIKKLKAN